MFGSYNFFRVEQVPLKERKFIPSGPKNQIETHFYTGIVCTKKAVSISI